VYLAPQIRFKYRSAQAAKRGETLKRYESFVTKANNKATTYGEIEEGISDSPTSRARSHSESLLANDHLHSQSAFGDDGMDASLLADMGTPLCAVTLFAHSYLTCNTARAGDFDDTEEMALSDTLEFPETSAARDADDTFVDPSKICCQCLITGTVRNVTRNRAAGCTCFVKWILTCILFPLKMLFKYTCPPCELETKWERLYPLTFLVSFIWVAVFSFVISTVVDRWVGFAPATADYLSVIFGVILVAGGAEIPDTLQSVLYARQGYGSMAVSNCIGSQICNIFLGLGLPWTISNIIGTPVRITNYERIQAAAFFQFGNVILNFVVLVGAAFVLKQNKALLGRAKGLFLLIMYVLVVGAFCAYTVLAPSTNATASFTVTTAAPLS